MTCAITQHNTRITQIYLYIDTFNIREYVYHKLAPHCKSRWPINVVVDSVLFKKYLRLGECAVAYGRNLRNYWNVLVATFHENYKINRLKIVNLMPFVPRRGREVRGKCCILEYVYFVNKISYIYLAELDIIINFWKSNVCIKMNLNTVTPVVCIKSTKLMFFFIFKRIINQKSIVSC